MQVKEIKDSYFVTYGIFYSMGVLTFVPYQFFTIATEYWMFKFRDPYRDIIIPTNPSGFPSQFPPHKRLNWSDDFHRADDYGYAHERTPLQATFTSSFSLTCQISTLGFLIVTALFSKRLPPPSKRILGALLSMLVLFLINAAFTKINTDSFQTAFFALTMILAVLINLCSAVIMISLFELVSKFPLGYFAVILSGQAICAVCSSLVQIMTLSINRRIPPVGGLIFFGVGTLIIMFTTGFYLITKKKSKYFIYRVGQYEGTCSEIKDAKWTVNLYKLKTAMYRTKWFLGSLMLVEGATNMIHPGLAVLVVSVEEESGPWSDIYFVPVITFFCFHSADLLGREIARRVKRPTNAIMILTLAILRITLVPIIMLCNAQPRKNMPVFFGDSVYIAIIIIFGYSQGFLVNLCILSIPKVARKEELEFATMLVPVFTMVTVTICSAFNMLIISLI